MPKLHLMVVSVRLDLSVDSIALTISLVMVWFKVAISANGLAPGLTDVGTFT
jgi:hypothetical protein